MRVKIKKPQKKIKNSLNSYWPYRLPLGSRRKTCAKCCGWQQNTRLPEQQDLPRRPQAGKLKSKLASVSASRITYRPECLALGTPSPFEQVSGLAINTLRDGILARSTHRVSLACTLQTKHWASYSAGTGLSYKFVGPGRVAIDLKSVAATVDVTTNIDSLAASSAKFSQPPLETPQTITSVTQTVMQQQAVTTLRDALRNVAGISLAAGEGGAQGDNLTIRGFTARNDLFIDGMRDFGSYYRDPFNTQEVEVLQGPSSVTFGRGSTGGVVNQAAKSPGLAPNISGDVDFGTDLTRRGVLDVNRPVHLFGKEAAFRLNIMGDEGGIAGRDVAENRRFGVAPSLAFGLGTPTRLTLSYFHQNADDTPDYVFPGCSTAPPP